MRFLFLLLSAAFILFCGNPSFACTNPVGAPGDMMYNATHNIFQGCTDKGWMAFHAPAATPPIPTTPQNCPNAGDVCTNGMIYAGMFSGNRIYAAANDAPTTLAWGPYQDAVTETGMGLCTTPYTSGSCNTGRENTQILIGLPLSYPAAEYCAALSAHGQSTGWYLPSRNELGLIYDNLRDGRDAPADDPTYNFHQGVYWSSSENSRIFAFRQHFTQNTGWQDAPNNNNPGYVRCVWR